MSDERSPSRSTIGRRILAAFAAVLALFAAALAVELITLDKIASAESEVDRLDHAKHAGHLAAAQVREQYIHQAHTLIEFGPGHLAHYRGVATVTKQSITSLRGHVDSPADIELVDQIARLAEENDREFRELVVPAIARGDRGVVADLGEKLEEVVDRVVALNGQLNANLEARSLTARERAEQLRDQSLVWTIVCFALAIAAAAGLGWWLRRTIVGRVESLRRGARRVGAGDLDARIELQGHDELADLAESFNQMAASLAREQTALVRAHRLASIGQVAAGVAHELNNPLTVILGYTKLLRAAPGVHADELRIIDDEARLCQRIVQELLDLARPHRLAVESVDLALLAREAIDRLGDTGALRDRHVQLLATGPVVVSADAGKLRQVIANVVINAAEATTSTGTITIDARATADHATLTVADDGPGMSPEVRDQVFEPFFTTKAHGTGLGLAIAHAIVEAHGGRLSITSSGSAGTLVSLQLPTLLREASSP